jgi:hypothetical protein
VTHQSKPNGTVIKLVGNKKLIFSGMVFILASKQPYQCHTKLGIGKARDGSLDKHIKERTMKFLETCVEVRI